MSSSSVFVLDRKCDANYDSNVENLKYLAQFAYLAPSAVLQARILWILFWKCRKYYLKHSFYIFFGMDCWTGFILVILDIFFSRIFQYFPQFCIPLTTYFKSNSGFSSIYYPLQNYLHSAQPIIQIFLTTNRMSCVLWPIKYSDVGLKSRILKA
ncbi:unnamed protein product [Caenorhabditis angaria]|uniref:Serpentine receptor class gamma n=1 Tax=Caenorhabditis angaria TaxID=860376 RepID=A0A9P1III0_9PELO|nr:unnamed protein product [Caenorhabditis angaria]